MTVAAEVRWSPLCGRGDKTTSEVGEAKWMELKHGLRLGEREAILRMRRCAEFRQVVDEEELG